VNDYLTQEAISVPTLYIDQEGARAQIERLVRVRRERDQSAVRKALDNLRRVAEGTGNTMPAQIEAVQAYATLGEIMDVFREAFGTYQELAVY
jgi:methylmalonyl-CoA mutase N-terminal domain/subunit